MNSINQFDYLKAAYELLKNENESLNHTVFKLNKDLDETSKVRFFYDYSINLPNFYLKHSQIYQPPFFLIHLKRVYSSDTDFLDRRVF